ncbi:MAG: hypothetical protein OQJ83_06760, partial [Altibacter sp.]|nr:hypothetical protein [Altibacter sp.]
NGNISLGAAGSDGDLTLFASDGVNTIHLNGDHGNLRLGGRGHDGDISLKNAGDVETIQLNGEEGNITLGANGRDGDIFMKSSDGVQTIHLNGEHGNIELGANGHDGDLLINNSNGERTIELNGDTGDIILKNADFAEDFDVLPASGVDPGSVVVIDKKGKLKPCTVGYDTTVVGVISGAGNYQPGMILDRHPERENRSPVAMLGKVSCKVDADYFPIEVGDMLTTSLTKGHAMKAEDNAKPGTIIGKALTPLANGRGYVDILVNLQ